MFWTKDKKKKKIQKNHLILYQNVISKRLEETKQIPYFSYPPTFDPQNERLRTKCFHLKNYRKKHGKINEIVKTGLFLSMRTTATVEQYFVMKFYGFMFLTVKRSWGDI